MTQPPRNRRPHGGILFGLVDFVRNILDEPGASRRFSIGDAAKALAEQNGSVRRVLERRFLDHGIVSPVRASGSKRVREYEIAEDAAEKLAEMLPQLFPLRQQTEQDVGRRVVTHLRSLEDELGKTEPDVALQAAMLETVRDGLERDLRTDDATAEVDPGQTVRRPTLVVWFLIEAAVHHFFRDDRDACLEVWRTAQASLADLRRAGAPYATRFELSFLEERLAVARRRTNLPVSGVAPVAVAAQRSVALAQTARILSETRDRAHP